MTLNPLATRPRVEIPPRAALTKAQKTAIWNRENGLCVLCGKPVPPEGPDVQFDHATPREINGDDSPEGIFAVHVACHQAKTSGHDAPLIAKVRRQEKLTKAKVRKAGGIRAWRKFNGEIVRR
jgi:hypothetical protein